MIKNDEILISAGKGSYKKDFLEVEFLINEKKYKVKDLFEKIFVLENENKELRVRLENAINAENKVDSMLVQSLDIAQKKLVRIEKKLED